VTKVEFYDGATLKATDTAAPFTYAWAFTSANNGVHAWTAKAYDAANNWTISAPVSLTVNIAGAAPPGPWVHSFGGTGSDTGSTVVVDSGGNIYTAGTFNGTCAFGSKNLTSAGMRDIFLMKTASDGTLQWVFRFGSTGDEAVRQIVLDGTGNIFLCGTFTGSGSFGGAATLSAGGSDGFIAKYSPQGAFLWSRTLGGLGADQVNGIALDSTQQNVIAIGTFAGTVTFTPTTTFSSQSGGADSFLAKYSAVDGSPVWAKTWGSLDYDIGANVFVDAGNNILVVGCFAYQINFGSVIIASDPGFRDIYIAKFAPSGSVAPGAAIWAKRYGSISNTTPYCAGLDKNGDLTVGGIFTAQSDLGRGILTGSGPSYSTFLAKYSGVSGINLWSRAISGNSTVVSYGVRFDTLNNPIVCGNYDGTCNFGNQTFTSAGSVDVFAAKYNGASGSPVWAESFGGAGADSGSAIAVDGANYSAVVGYFSGSANFGGSTLTSAGGVDIFLLRLDP
jgi:hypothetical protein